MITKSTFDFLGDLFKNNRREWFAENRPRYETAKQEMIETAAQMIDLINKFDPALGFPDPKRALFRINRDTRFSKDKEPYKTHMGMAFSSQGVANSNDSSYYMHIEPNNCFVAAGLFMPMPEQLKAVRTEIEINWEEFSKIVKNPKFIETFGDLCRNDKVLKRAPKGFSEESHAIHYLKLCSFYVFAKIDDKTVLSNEYCSKVAEIFEVATPLHQFLNRAIKNE